MKQWELLELLKENQTSFLSGEDLATMLGVSRAAIWKYIKELKSIGYSIESKTNSGYKLEPYFDLLNEFEIKKAVEAKEIDGFEVLFLPTIDSTNIELKKVIEQGHKGNIIMMAEEQTAGRGRYDRRFHSDSKKGSYTSFSMLPPYAASELSFITIIAALSVAQVVDKYVESAENKVAVKWPNDVLINGQKICGILTELIIEAESGIVKQAIIGIGINVNEEKSDFPEKIREIATSLRHIAGREFQRADVAADILSQMVYLFEQNKEYLLDEYRKYLILNKTLKGKYQGQDIVGIAKDVTETGALIVDMNGAEIVINSGEIQFI